MYSVLESDFRNFRPTGLSKQRDEVIFIGFSPEWEGVGFIWDKTSPRFLECRAKSSSLLKYSISTKMMGQNPNEIEGSLFKK